MSKDPSHLISSYKKRQQVGPYLVWGMVVLLVIAGLGLLIAWMLKPNSPVMLMFATETPTPTVTPSTYQHLHPHTDSHRNTHAHGDFYSHPVCAF